MSELYVLAKGEIDAIIADFRGHVPTAGSLWQQVYNAAQASLAALERIDRVIHAIPGSTPAERQAAVLEAFDRFYVEVVAPIDLPGVPEYTERSIVDPAVGQIWHGLALALVDAIARLRERRVTA